MNAIELANALKAEWDGEGFQPDTAKDAATMLRRQHEAIKTLREVLDDLTTAGEEAWGTERPCVQIGLDALKATKELG